MAFSGMPCSYPSEVFGSVLSIPTKTHVQRPTFAESVAKSPKLVWQQVFPQCLLLLFRYTHFMNDLSHLLNRWQVLLRLRDWDIQLQMVTTPWRKTGDIKIDLHDRKAVLLINEANPKNENLEEVIIHELLHLKLWGLDQMLENLLKAVFGDDEKDPRYQFANDQFMDVLETTVEDLTKGYLQLGGEDKELSFGRVQVQVAQELRP